jgi:predicted esterase
MSCAADAGDGGTRPPGFSRRKKRRGAALFIATLALLGCDADLPTASKAPDPGAPLGLIDDSQGFGALFCAIARDHGSLLRHARPCGKSLHGIGEDVHSRSPPPVPGRQAFSSVRLVVVPGIFGECVARYALPFLDAAQHLKAAHGLASMDWIPVSGRSSSRANAAAIARWLRQHPTAPGQRLILIGYSKGATDLIEAAVRHERAFPPRSAIVGVAGAVMGTPVADRSKEIFGALSRLELPNCAPGDGRGAESLTTAERRAFARSKKLPSGFSYFSLPAFAPTANVSRALRPSHAALQRHGGRNDGQMLARDAVIAPGRLLGFANADHWAVALPLREAMPWAAGLLDRNDYPRAVLLEAIIAAVLAVQPAEVPLRPDVSSRASSAREPA